MKRRKVIYVCPHCGRKHGTFAMKDICERLCAKLLEHGKPLFTLKLLAMPTRRITLEFMQQNLPKSMLDERQRRTLAAADCKMIKDFKKQKDHFNIWSRTENYCFTVVIDEQRKQLKIISEN